MDIYGKPEETVDFGQEVDYTGFEWFKDIPARTTRNRTQPVNAPPQVSEPFEASPDIVEQNEVLSHALASAPNVLYYRFRQFGQLGVLGWCNEFAEMIDAIKMLGLEGNMLMPTRQQALDTCREILALHLDIPKSSPANRYLSTQVARLRRFLDPNQIWDDYPEPQFPLDYRKY
jgi:hypothetical protein